MSQRRLCEMREEMYLPLVQLGEGEQRPAHCSSSRGLGSSSFRLSAARGADSEIRS